MREYKKLTEQKTTQLGFFANYSFAKDSKNLSDIMECSIQGIKGKTYEHTIYNPETKTIDLKILTEKENEIWYNNKKIAG